MDDSALIRLAQLVKVRSHRRRGLHGQSEQVDAYIRKDLDVAAIGTGKTRKGAFTGADRTQPTTNAFRLPDTSGRKQVKAPGEPVKKAAPRDKKDDVIPPEEKARIRAKLAAHPVDSKHVLAMYDQATDRERRVGREWYPEAHRIAVVMAKEHGLTVRQVAGLIANYSAQKAFGRNLIEANEVARTRKGIGGLVKDGNNTISYVPSPSAFSEIQNGSLAGEPQRAKADRILAGEDFQDVFAGERLKNGGLPSGTALKVRAFAELIARGGQDPDADPPRVVIDRHAASVARGIRFTEDDYTIDTPSGSKKKFEVYATAYRDAADVLSKQQGRKVTPEEVQAVTWLARQRLNMDDIAARRALGVQDVENSLNYFASYLPGVADIIDDPMVGYAALHSEEELRDLAATQARLAEAGDELRAAMAEDPLVNDVTDPLVNVASLSAADGPGERVMAALQRIFAIIDSMGKVSLSAGDSRMVALAKVTRVQGYRRRSDGGGTDSVQSYVRKQLDPYGPGASAKTRAGAYAAKVASSAPDPHKSGRGGNRVLKAKEVAKEIESRGGKMVRQTGSHRLFEARYAGGTVKAVVPMHNGDMAPGTMRSVEKSMEPAFGPGWLTG